MSDVEHSGKLDLGEVVVSPRGEYDIGRRESSDVLTEEQKRLARVLFDEALDKGEPAAFFLFHKDGSASTPNAENTTLIACRNFSVDDSE